MRRIILLILLLIPLSVFSQSAIEYNRLGNQKLIENDVYSSLEYFSKSIELNPRFHQSLFGMAQAYFRLAEYDAAEFYIGLAQQLSKNNLEYKNLEGRIKVGLNEIESAHSIFNDILKKEPYNLSARLGVAEIDLIENRFNEAEAKYHGTLNISPESKRALLSLLLLYDTMGEYAKGDLILSRLDDYYSYDPDVKIAASEHYFRSGDLDRAEESSLTLFSLESGSDSVRPLLAKIYLEKDEPDKAVSFLEEELKYHRNDLELRYLLAISYRNIGRITESIHNFDYILKYAPYDEVSRLAAENLAVQNHLQNKIEEYSQYHFNEGSKYEGLFLYDRALAEYRRGLRINPDSVKGRLQYADIYKKRGYPGKYLDILNLLEWNGYDDPDFLKSKRQVEHLRTRTIADAWAVDQFNLVKNQYLLDIYIKKPDVQSYHSLSELIIADSFEYELEKYDRLNQVTSPLIIKEDIEAYRGSHKSDSDYYLILEYSESERVFSINVSVYLSRTGVKMDSYAVLRAGNNKIGDALKLVSRFVNNFFPYRGSVISINDKDALINLGRLDGLALEDRFLIVRKHKARFTSEPPWYEVSDEDKLGLLTITALDEAVSVGNIQNPGFFDLVNPGDEIYIVPEDQEIILEPDYGYNDSLKRELLKIY
jgi:tetratricopeptide (TPR) repeat protein